jgi:hypothetical protein
MMEEDVFSVVRLDEAETFVLHQFFNLARWHTQALLTRILEIQLRRTASHLQADPPCSNGVERSYLT